MIATSDFKKGAQILVDGQPFTIVDYTVQSPSARGAATLFRTKVRNMRSGTVQTADQNFDLVCANLTADVILPILPELLDKTNRTLVLSGILAEQRDMIESKIPKRFTPIVEQDGEWIAVIVQKI